MRRALAGLGLGRRVSVLVAESQDLVRLGVRALLAGHGAFEVVGEASTVAGAVAATVERRPALVVIAPALADGTGLDGCREILARVPQTRIVILGERVDAACAAAALRVGALDWLSRYMDPQRVCRALRDAAAGVSHPVAVPAPPRDLLSLTGQERRVLALVAQGRTNKEIGRALDLSEKTVKNYLSHAFEKLHASRRAQAAVLFVRRYGPRPAADETAERWHPGLMPDATRRATG
jgi:two-component system, NarL family, response regulator DevR